ncbi:hypothetical protein CMV_011108 [Castanea mollissima]|uniref:Bifunctional inhibitor/plant lipid transfer protein/seed storage helical domain-containing protein n=1 Tax=Castanea mollissima TaxID=60419 RepID=A0A8J4VPF8_9ROSI|nr:hypothetical protein CMV_011108 [Castanea mollissima]
MGKKLVMLILVVLLVERSSAVTLCKMDDNGLAACKPAVTQPNPVDPTPECCKALSGADLPCLLQYHPSCQLLRYFEGICHTFMLSESQLQF